MTDTTATPGNAPNNENKDTSFFGHPKGLAILFLTEMWERFSYYGMRGLLIIYLTQHFLFSDERSGIMYGAYTALVYIMTIIGGTLADRYLGQRKAVTYGAILLVIGHGLMAFEGSGSRETIVASDQNWVIEDEGRGGDRQLFVDHDGELRRLTFISTTYADIDGLADDGGVLRLSGPVGDTPAAYEIEEGSRGGLAAICAVIGLPCAGEAPTSYISFGDTRYELVDGAEEGARSVIVGDREYPLAISTETDAQILASADREAEPTADVLMTIEHGTYTTEVERQELFVNILYLALAFIIAGVGFLKANISTIVGSLYGLGDTRRDSGFTIFYMGINLGSFLASFSVGIIGIYWGWAWGFGLAGIGMLAGLLTFLFFQPWLEGRAEPPNPAKLKEKVLGFLSVEWACYAAGLGIILVSMAIVKFPDMFADVAGWLGIIMFLVLVAYAVLKTQGDERKKMFAAIYFVLAQIPFWALFEQAGSSLNLFTDRLVDRTMFGWSVPAPVFQSLNAGFIFLFAPLVAWLWIALAKKGWNPSTPVKFALGVFMAGLGFYTLVGGMGISGTTGLTAVYFIFLIYWIHTMGELMVSPVGLSAVTKLAPPQVVGMTMGAWFLYSGLSNFLAGVIASSTGAETIGGQLTDVAAAKAGYVEVYSNVGMVGMGIALVMLLISPVIKWLMAGADGTKVIAQPTETEAGGPSVDR